MVIGRGDIASVLPDREGFTFFASGFANRTPFNQEEKNKEVRKVMAHFNKMANEETGGMFVYISSLSIYYAHNEYTRHKHFMESVVAYHFPHCCILRIGNIIWGSNPNTLINSLTHKIKNNLPYETQDAYRYLIDEEELVHWCNLIPKTGKHEMNVTGRRMKVSEIVEEIKRGSL